MKRVAPSRELAAYLDRELPSPVAAPQHPRTQIAVPGAGAVPLAPAPLAPLAAAALAVPAAAPAPHRQVPGLATLRAHHARLPGAFRHRQSPRRFPAPIAAISAAALLGLGALVVAVFILLLVVAAVAHARPIPGRRASRQRARPTHVIAADSSANASVATAMSPSLPGDDSLVSWCATPRTPVTSPPHRSAPVRTHVTPPGPQDARGWPVLLAVLGTFALIGAVVTVDARRGRARRRVAADRLRRVGVGSRTGGRPYNEDRAAAFVLGEYDVIVCADGLGGHAGGARAASLVVESSERHLRAALAAIPPLHIELVEDAVRGAFARAAEALASEERALGFSRAGVDGLRSTLIIAVATPGAYVVGAQGDGGALVRRFDGALVPLMSPAKAGAQNILAASLGPVSDGTPELRRESRKPGDLLVVSTDGVSDRVNDTFYEAFAQIVADAPTALGAIHDTLVELEQDPVVFNDNMTLAALVTAAP